jgi:aminobenzoyl-glutamate transport protein
VFLALTLWLVMGPAAPLRLPGIEGTDGLKPFFESIVILVMLLFLFPGIAYGIVTGSVRSDRDLARMAGESMSTMGTYIVLAFVAAQFVNWFAWSNLATILAVNGAHLLKAMHLEGAPLMVGLVFVTAFLNLFTSSASAKWATFAPVFVPMFLLLGFSPEGTQVIYRIGDSATNIVTPLLPYMPFILTFIKRYDPEAGMGTLIAMMVPYSVAFLLSWTVLLLVWSAFGWPIGPGVFLRLS